MDQTPQPQPHQPHQPEVLESGGGGPIDKGPRPGRRRGPVVAGLGVLGLGLVGGAAFGAYWYLADGAQAAEAFPADTVGYVGLTLDPSGQQKLAALETLREFPTLADELDLEGPLEDVDLKRSVAEAVLAEAPCDLDYAADVAPWLGDRFGVAAVPAGEALPSAVLALEVTDADAADAGIRALLSCDGSDPESVAGWEVSGDWMVVAETPGIAADVAGSTAEGSLADDEDFQRWTGEAGDEGVLTAYAAPEAPSVLSEALGEVLGTGPGGGMPSSYAGGVVDEAEELEELEAALEDFEGMGAVLRFADGLVEVEVAASAVDATDAVAGGAGELVTGLPDETAAVLAAGLVEGWSEDLPDDADLPFDLEALLGDAVALAVGPDLDPDALLEAVFGGRLGEVPVAAVTRGGLAEAEEALAQAGPFAASLEAREVGDTVVVGPTGPWLDAVEAGGSLGDTDLFSSVVPDADEAVMVLFLDLVTLAGVAAEADESGDLDALRALGASARLDGDVARALLRLTTD